MRHTVLIAGLGVFLALPWVAAAADPAPANPAPPPASPLPAPPPPPPADLSTPSPAPSAGASSTSPTSSMEDLQKQLSDNQDKLNTTLRSYELLNDENRQLKADAEKYAAEKASLEAQIDELRRSNSFYQAQAAIVGQVDSLHMQLRQAQNQTADLASENAELRTRLALSPSPGGGGWSAPMRPGAAPLPPAAASAAGPGTASPAAATPAPRIHIVAEGDTLSGISKKYYGTANRWDEILKANHGVLHDENHLTVGQKLTIP